MMICFMDKTFCSADCATENCHRILTPELQVLANKWGKGLGCGEPPIAFSDFTNHCVEYTQKKPPPK